MNPKKKSLICCVPIYGALLAILVVGARWHEGQGMRNPAQDSGLRAPLGTPPLFDLSAFQTARERLQHAVSERKIKNFRGKLEIEPVKATATSKLVVEPLSPEESLGAVRK